MALPALGFAVAFLRKHEARAAEHQAIGRLGDALAAEILLTRPTPRRIRHVQMDVIVGKRRRLRRCHSRRALRTTAARTQRHLTS